MASMTPESQTLRPQDLEAAAAVPVWTEDGKIIPFGDLFKEQKTIVVFIRKSGIAECS